MGGEVALEEALEGGRNVVRRLALLHMAYARTLVDALGEEEGRRLVEQAIRRYGALIGERTRQRVEAQGLEPTPEHFAAGSDLSPLLFPSEPAVAEGERRSRSASCLLAEVWAEYGEEALGALYCLVDPAKMEAYNPAWTMVHTRRLPLGDACCEFAVRSVMPAGGRDED